jgi:aminocarboxymuconate-semialdehyde decarboxylase
VIIDFHSHLYPAALQYDPAVLPSIFDIPGLVRSMDEAGIDAKVVSNPFIYPPDRGVDLHALDWVRRYNDFIAEAGVRHRGRIHGLAAAVPFGGPEHLRETERALRDLGLRGVSVSSSVAGEYLDSPRAADFFHLVVERGVPVFVHPQSRTVGDDLMRPWRLVELLGRPADTTLTAARLVFAGVLERFPALTLVLAHVGGFLALLVGRLDMGWEVRNDPGMGPPWGAETLAEPPSASLRRLYVDTMCYHPPAIRAAVETFGIDHVVFGSDCPPVPLPVTRHLEAIRRVGLAKADLAKVLGGNAARLLRLNA